MKPVIKVENLSKQYRLGNIGTGSIKDDVKRWRYKMMGLEDPFLTVGELNDRTTTSKSDYVWALKDINFEVQQGDVLGIIGRNGAGKSTLLKILSRTTGPTMGTVKMKGRIASLLEVGTGFHGELSGRENIYLNGAIMGLRKHEIKQKLDEIIDFAGVERYIDTPVKRYSSGMYMRLAFAVAAHLEPDIMIVDEVLAVGDTEFQKKCLGKMKDVSQNDGRTILFVSHNMNAIQTLCKTCIFMENGKVVQNAETAKILKVYLKASAGKIYNAVAEKKSQEIYLSEAYIDTDHITDAGYAIINTVIISKVKTKISIDIKFVTDLSIPVAFASLGTLNYDELLEINEGETRVSMILEVKDLALGEYSLSIDLTLPNEKYYDRCDECLSIDVVKAAGRSRQLQQDWQYGYFTLPIKKL